MKIFEEIVAHLAGRQFLPQEKQDFAAVQADAAERAHQSLSRQLHEENLDYEKQKLKEIREDAEKIAQVAREVQEITKES